jgi:hypothetical protein
VFLLSLAVDNQVGPCIGSSHACYEIRIAMAAMTQAQTLVILSCCRDVAEKRKARKGDSGLTGPVDIPEVLLEKLGFPRKIQFQKV